MDGVTEPFVKHRSDAPEAFFAWEAAGLRWLAEPDDGPRVVGVRDVSRTSITLDRLTPAAATRDAAHRFGAALARLHRSGAAGFGAPPPGWAEEHGWIGRQVLPLVRPAHQDAVPAAGDHRGNGRGKGKDDGSTGAWGAFYAEHRLRPYLRAARDAGRFDRDGVALVERVCARLEAGTWDDGRPPARLHGDLWGGNVLYVAGGSGVEAVLIDPAAHGGHGETDLAMLSLFGTEHLRAVEDAYASEAGLDAGWRERTGLHQLHPVLVHAVSHGPSYAAHALDLAHRYA